MTPADPDYWFWRIVTWLILGSATVFIVYAAIGLSLAFLRGDVDADVAEDAPLPDLSSRSGTADRPVADVSAVSDVRSELAWMGTPRRPSNGHRPAHVAPARARKDR